MKQLRLYFFSGIILTLFSLLQLSCNPAQESSETELDALLNANRITLPNGWSLSVPGKSIAVGDLPLNLIKSADGNMLAITNNGQSEQSIMLIDPKTFSITSKIKIAKSWYGLTFNNQQSKLFASGGNDNIIRIYDTS